MNESQTFQNHFYLRLKRSIKKHHITLRYLDKIAASLINYRDPVHKTSLLHVAAMAKNDDAVAMLLSIGYDPNVIDAQARVPLHYTALNDVALSTEALLITGSQIDVYDNFGLTPLHYAVCYSAHITKMLLQYGADPNGNHTKRQYFNSMMITPLINAIFNVSSNGKDIIKLLLDYGANPHIAIYDGEKYRDALDMAKRYGMHEAIQLLESAYDENHILR